MPWTDRADSDQCCPGPLGEVGSAESVARLTLIRTAQPLNFTAFNQRDLYPPTNQECVDACGTEEGQHGLSVARATNLTAEDLVARSDAQAARRPNRVGDGAFVALAADVRAIRSGDFPNDQVFMIYDDPIPSDPLHAVIRASEHVPLEERPTILGELQELFEADHRRA